MAVVSWLEAQPGDTWPDRGRAPKVRRAGGGWSPAGGQAGPERPSAADSLPPHIGGGLMLFLCGSSAAPLRRCDPARHRVAAATLAHSAQPGCGDRRTRDTAAFAELAALSPSGSVCAFARLAALDKITGSRPGYFKDANGAAPGGRLRLALDSFTAASM